MTATITLFTKPDCSYCRRAKATLQDARLDYDGIDVTASPRYADMMVWLSGASTTPQTFIGARHVNGSGDLTALHDAGMLKTLAKTEGGALPLEQISDAELHEGAEDVPLHRVIPRSDGTHDPDPETWPILHFYKQFFGFWPSTFAYLHYWPEAYKEFVYNENFAAIGAGRDLIGEPVMMAVGFGTSNAHGCNYCMVHSVATAGEMSLGMGALVEAARNGKAPDDSPIGPFELALTDLAAAATTNSVSDAHLRRVHDLSDKARVSGHGPADNIMGATLITSAFGFLNVFNDLCGVEVEAHWADQATDKAGVETGRHGTDSRDVSHNLDHDLPKGGPTMQEMIALYRGQVEDAGGVDAYAESTLGLLPAWVALWPERLQAQHLHFYCTVMRSDDTATAEIKHLMARVSAICRNHDVLAMIEGWLAWNAVGRTDLAVGRMQEAYTAATSGTSDLFDPSEIAALRLAWLSAQLPLTTPRRFAQPAVDAFETPGLIRLFTVCGMAGLIQRFSAVMKPEPNEQVRDFFAARDLVTDSLRIRYSS